MRNPKSRQDISGHLLDSDRNIRLQRYFRADGRTNGCEPTVPFEVFDDYRSFAKRATIS
ncbi:MAG: hypothetical protein ACLS7Z_11705 [Christensenellales bacterium]